MLSDLINTCVLLINSFAAGTLWHSKKVFNGVDIHGLGSWERTERLE